MRLEKADQLRSRVPVIASLEIVYSYMRTIFTHWTKVYLETIFV